MSYRLVFALVGLTASLLLTTPASASYRLGANATGVRLAVNGRGLALVTYHDAKGIHRVLAWGSIDTQLKFKLDYSGGWGTFKRPVWKTFKDRSQPYDGPALAWLVTARKAPDGSYWALQAWQRKLPNLGYDPWKPAQAAWELRLSHWRGEIPKLEIWLDWVYSKHYAHLFGRYTYHGKPVYGFKATSSGVPLDPYGRNVYLDTFNANYGAGWRRENSFLTHNPNGNFCYGFYPRQSYYDDTRRPAGDGERYRATVIGPGVAPDAYWEGTGHGHYDPKLEEEMNALGDQIAAGDQSGTPCTQH